MTLGKVRRNGVTRSRRTSLTSITVALRLGAVVGEYLGFATGLGYLIHQAEGVFDVAECLPACSCSPRS